MDQIALGKRIKAAREKACMTQEELAAAVDYSVDHMSVVERGVKAPKLEKLVAIANALNIGTDELLQDDLNTATMLHATEISERLKMLSPEGQGNERTGCPDCRVEMISGTEVCTFCKPLFFSTEFDVFSQSSYAIIVLKERFPFKK